MRGHEILPALAPCITGLKRSSDVAISQFKFFCVNVSVAAGNTANSICGPFGIEESFSERDECGGMSGASEEVLCRMIAIALSKPFKLGARNE